MGRVKVNLQFLPIKAHFFLYFGGTASLLPFFSVFAKQLGISEVGVGIIFAVSPIAGLISKPLFGAIADRFKKKKTIFIFFILLTLISYLGIAFLPQSQTIRPVYIDCTSSTSYIRQCSLANTKCDEGTIVKSFKHTKNKPHHSSLTDTESEAGENTISSSSSSSTNTNHDHHINSFPILSSEAEFDEIISEKEHQEKEEEKESLSHSRSKLKKRSILKQEDHFDTCYVHCEIKTFAKGIKFCKNVRFGNSPEICNVINMYNETSSSSSSSSSSETNSTEIKLNTKFSKIPQGPQDHSRISNSHSHSHKNGNRGEDEDDKPTIINLAARIKVQDITLAGECLFLPIETVSFKSNEEDHLVFLCHQKVLLDTCYANCPKNKNLNSHMEVILSDYDLFNSRNFWVFGSLFTIGWIAMAVVTSFGDTLTYETLGTKPHLFGQQRQWGAIGFGLFSLIAGGLIDGYSEGQLLKDYTPSFYLVAGLLLIDLVVAYKWDIKETVKPKSLRKDIFDLITNLRIFVFIFACIVVGMCTGLLWSFLFWYIEDLYNAMNISSCDHSNWTRLLMGFVTAVQCFGGEWPFFYLSGYFIKRFGHTNCMTLVLGTFGVRYLIYSVIVNPWTILPVELLQGINYGIFYATMTSYANKISPPGTAATVQGIFGASFEGIGVAVGTLVSGLFFEKLGGRITFRIFGVGSLIFCFIYFLLMYFIEKKTSYILPIPTEKEPDEGQEMFSMSNSGQDESDE